MIALTSGSTSLRAELNAEPRPSATTQSRVTGHRSSVRAAVKTGLRPPPSAAVGLDSGLPAQPSLATIGSNAPARPDAAARGGNWDQTQVRVVKLAFGIETKGQSEVLWDRVLDMSGSRP